MLQTQIQTLTGEVVGSNILLKISAGFFVYLLERFVIPDKQLLVMILIIYIIDMITGSIRALEIKNFSSRRFFRGLMKLGVYGALLLIAFALDIVILEQHIFTSIMIAFILINDSISILENLNELGFQTPIFLQKFLKSYTEKYFKDKLKLVDQTAFQSVDYLSDINDILVTYIPKIKNPQLQSVMKIKVEQWSIAIQQIQQIDIIDFEIFKSKFILIVSETLKEIDGLLERQGISNELIQKFADIQNPSVKEFIAGLDGQTNSKELESENSDPEIIKNSLLKQLLLIVYQATTEVLNESSSFYK